MIKSGLRDLKNEIKHMSESKIKRPDKIVNLVEKIVDAIKRQHEFYTPEESPRDMPDLETEESAKQKRYQRVQGLKILTPQQMLNRLTICLMDHILFLIYKIILNISPKNMKLLQIILLYKFM